MPLSGEGTIVFLSLGSNLGERRDTILEAIRQLDAIVGVKVLAVSELKETKPIGPVQQPDFINGVAKVKTDLEPLALLDVLLGIERKLGRERRERWGPRTIDLDILTFGDRRIDDPRLKVPHPELPNRPFWQEGLKELGA